MKSEFLDYMQEKYALKTQVNYLRSLRHLEAQGIVLEDKDSFRSWAISQRNKGTRDRTINVYLKSYNAYLDFLQLPRFRPYKTYDSVKRDRATMDDYRLLLQACRGYTEPRDRLIVELLFKAGIRYRELISLSLDNITEDTITVEAGKNQKYREIVTFPSVAKRAGIEFSPHRARRFFARHLWESGVKVELIQKAMGHEKLDTTLTYISPDGTDAFREMREKMKKLDFRVPPNRGGQISDHMVRLGRVAAHMVQIWRKPYGVTSTSATV